MKKTLLYSLGVAILLALAGLWAYSFLYGSPENTPSFANFNFFGADVPVTPITPNATTTPMVDVKKDQLRQLTTKPVIGMRIITADNNSVMRYVEGGTGHIFDINLETGEEKRVSGISVPLASQAKVSETGDYIAIRSGYTLNNEVVVVDLDDIDSPIKQDIPVVVDSFAFGPNDTLYVSEVVGSTLVAKQYMPRTQQISKLFTVPFTAARIIWSSSSTTPHYVQVKPAQDLSSYLYKVTGSKLSRLPITGVGLTVLSAGDKIYFSHYIDNDTIESFIYDSNGLETVGFPTLMEKCVSSVLLGSLICGVNRDTVAEDLPTVWYTGEYSFSDRIWEHEKSGVNTQLINPEQNTGRSIDVMDMSISSDGSMLYFLNKIDLTLWTYEL